MRASLRIKRFLDLALCLIAAPVVLPLGAAIAAVIKMSSPGPVLYPATRVGRDMNPVVVLKFRTMRASSEGPSVTRAGDPRITWIGRWLRATKLDELPQLINVLKGEMSIVGPRPEDPKFVASYSPEQRRVLALTPGVTSLASVLFRHEQEMMERAQPADLEEYYRTRILPVKLAIELQYADTWTIRGDLRILAQTVAALFVRAPA